MEIAVISGKGGTGKSFISAAFATLDEKVVLADCDVDAANLYLIFDPENEEESVFVGGQKAKIDYNSCLNCGLCLSHCRFGAISFKNDQYIISETSCDGCKLCYRVCPAYAISMVINDKSRLYSGDFRNGKMVYGKLAPGEENSGKLVSIVRDKAKMILKSEKLETIIIDGPPGIGCSVVSSITGVDQVVIVTEPTISGLDDLKRTIALVQKFGTKTWVIINKFDLNLFMVNQIELYCSDFGIEIICKIPFDASVVEAMVNKKSVVEWMPDSLLTDQIRKAYDTIWQYQLTQQ